MHSSLAQKQVIDKTSASISSDSAARKHASSNEPGARASIPVFLQRRFLAPEPGDNTLQRQVEEEEESIQAKLGSADIQRQPMEEEEEALQPKLNSTSIQRQPIEEEEEMLQPKLGSCQLQRQVGEEEEEAIQAKPGNADIQRQPMEEEEEALQPKLNSTSIQRQPIEEEEEMLQPKPESSQLQRQAGKNIEQDIRAKFSVGEANDEYEQEADAVADQVMRMPNSATSASNSDNLLPVISNIQRKTNTPLYLQRICAQCKDEQKQMTSESAVQAKPESAASGHAGNQVSNTIRFPSAGVALSEGVKSRVEPVVGRDLSQVRVHQNGEAQRAASSINAKAFTHKNHIYLGKGESDQDLSLMAHEATHVVQQQGNMLHAKFNAPVIQRDMDAGVPDAMAADAGAGPADAGVELPAGVAIPAAPAPTGPNACATAEEEQRKNAFRFRFFSRSRFQPSSGFGMFDAYYSPLTSLMMVITKIKMNFIQADNTPDPLTLAMMILSGQDISPFFWTEAEKQQYKQDFISRIIARWSMQHTFRSTKPCWPFIANPVVTPMLVDSAAAAHFPFTIHKSPPATIEYKSAINWTQQASGNWSGEGQLYQSDVQENADFNSGDVARTERQRIDRAIAAASASPILFGHSSAVILPAEQVKLRTLANALKAKNPSDPAIPVKVDGFASSEGLVGMNNTLSRDRANAVADLLRAEGVPQPVTPTPRGPIGAPNDARNRKAVITTDTTFEASYASNRYSVAEHEFGHTLGLPDEYLNSTTGPLGTWQSGYDALARTAGVAPPDRWGVDTSSQMSNGVDVLPRHYLTLWEALGAMTTPDITRSEWSID